MGYHKRSFMLFLDSIRFVTEKKKQQDTISLQATRRCSVRFLEGEMTLLLIFVSETYLKMEVGSNAFDTAFQNFLSTWFKNN